MRKMHALLLLLVLCVPVARAETASGMGPAWDACFAARADAPDQWVGWRRDFGGGYGDNFQFYDRGEGAPSLLAVTWFIDGIARLDETFCFGADGALAGMLSEMHSPNMAGPTDAPSLTRRARIDFGSNAEVLTVASEILEGGEVVAATEDDRYRLARPCSPSQIYLDTDDVRVRIASVLSAFNGHRPSREIRELDWCGLDSGPSFND